MVDPSATTANNEDTTTETMTTPYNELKNTDSLMISFDRTFNQDDDNNNSINDQMKDVPYYQEFARDIVATLKQHRSIQGCVELLIACLAFVAIYSTLIAQAWWWSAGAVLIGLAVYFCVRTYLHTALCDTLYHRIAEWKRLVYGRPSSNYTLEWVPPEDWWNIYPGVQFIPKSTSTKSATTTETVPSAVAPPPPIKYYCKIARFAPPRDLTARTIQDSTARPPALLALKDNDGGDDHYHDDHGNNTAAAHSFAKFLATAKAQLLYDQREQLKRMATAMIISMLALWIATEDADWVMRGLFLTLVAFDIVDDCVLQHVLDNHVPTTATSAIRWNGSGSDDDNDDNNNNYTVTYHAEQPWFGLRETFFIIRRNDDDDTAAAAKPALV